MFSKFFKGKEKEDNSSQRNDEVATIENGQMEIVKSDKKEVVKSEKDVLDTIMSSTEAMTQISGLGHKIIDVYNNSLLINRSIKEIESKERIELNKLAQKYQATEFALTKVFAERQEALNAHYKSLEKGLQSDDRELIIESLRGISQMVSSRPLQDFNKLLADWKDTSKPYEIDF